MAKTKSNVVARLTMTHRDGKQFIVEVCADAGLRDFFRWYRSEKGKRKKSFLRGEHRPYPAKDLKFIAARTIASVKNLDAFAKRVGGPLDNTWTHKQIVSSRIVVYKKVEYKRLLTCPTDQLPGYKPVIFNSYTKEK